MSSNIESKIAKLLAKAESTTPEEAKALTEAAQRLMIKFGIEQAEIDARRAGRSGEQAGEKIVEKRILLEGRYYNAQILRMGHMVAGGLGNLRTLQSGTATRGYMLWVIGYEGDVARFETLFASLQIQAITAMRAWWKRNYFEGTAMEQLVERREFLVGFGREVGAKTREVYQQVRSEAAPEGSSTALALLDRGKKVDEYIDRNMSVGRRRARRESRGSGYAAAAGRSAGRNADVGATRVSSGSSRSIGR